MADYKEIFKYYEKCLDKYGANYKGVDWPNKEDLDTRFKTMLGVIRDKNTQNTVLDFGCGVGLLVDYILDAEISNIDYIGLDISEKFIEASRQRHPDKKWVKKDILKEDLDVEFDYAICNGTFTERLSLDDDIMFDFLCSAIKTLFNKSEKGVAFNVMSNHVDYKVDSLFYLSHDRLTEFIVANLSRNYIIRNDYKLYEYTVYVYK